MRSKRNYDPFIENILDRVLGNKTAQEKLDDESGKFLSLYVVVLRALYLIHQQNHWETKGYDNHLLFQRLYEDVLEDVDSAAERTIGLTGDLRFKGMEGQMSKKFVPSEKTALGYLQSSMDAEKEYQKVVKNVYEKLKEKNSLTLGLDDMLMSQAGKGESRIYLLEHALANY